MSEPTRVTPQLVSDLQAPSGPALSPDGQRLAWTTAPYGRAGEHPESSLWVADLASGAPARRWTRGHDDQAPAWSPDGRHLAFRSDRAERGVHGLHLLELDGGEARPLVERTRSVAAFAWAPDGGSLWFLAPDEPTDDDERREKDRDDAEVWGERWRHHRLWRVALDDEHSEGGAPTLVWAPDAHLAELAVSPDGTRVAALVRRSPLLEHGPSTTLWVHDGDAAREVCAASSAHGLTWWGPETVVYAGTHDGQPQGGATVWAVEPDAGATARVVGTGVDEPRCTTGHVSAHGRLVVAVAERLATRIEDVADGTRRVLVDVEGDVVDLALGGPTTACVVQAPGEPVGRVCVVDDGVLRPVALPEGAVPAVRLATGEALTATAPDGTEIDAVVLRPLDGGAGPWPTVVLPHGGPYGRDTLDASPYPLGGGWAQLLAARGYAVVLPNYRGGLGRGLDFAAQARGDMGGAEWADVEACVDAAVAAGVADPDRLGIGGWSQGGFLTAWAVTATDRYRAAVMGAGVSDWSMMAATSDLPEFEAALGGSTPWDGPGPHRASAGSPLSFAARCRTPLLILHGADDARVPLTQATAFHRALQRVGDPATPLELVVYPREPHGVRERTHQVDLQERVVAWFDRFLR